MTMLPFEGSLRLFTNLIQMSNLDLKILDLEKRFQVCCICDKKTSSNELFPRHDNLSLGLEEMYQSTLPSSNASGEIHNL